MYLPGLNPCYNGILAVTTFNASSETDEMLS